MLYDFLDVHNYLIYLLIIYSSVNIKSFKNNIRRKIPKEKVFK